LLCIVYPVIDSTMLLVLFASAVFAINYSVEKQFYQFKQDFNKNYTSYEEHVHRLEIFKANLKTIEEHNAKKLSWTFGVTQFADMTPLEFTAYVKRGNGGGFLNAKRESNADKFPLKGQTPSCTEIDWTTRGAVTPVKNQGQCGSCWSFSTTGAIEGRAVTMAGKSLVSLSEQELVDCDTVDQGCNGGLMDNGFNFVAEHNGLCTEDSYPYKAKKGYCSETTCGTKFDAVTGHQDVTQKSTSDLEAAVCEGPVSIAIEADQSAFQFYNGGVLTGSCGKQLDHGVLLVGIGTDSSYGDYWKVKNSWGANWGEQGYIRLCRNCNKNCGYYGECEGQCGLLGQPSYPTFS